MRLTSKGQVTVPKRLRDLAGVQPGSEVEFSYADGQIILSPARSGGGLSDNRAVKAFRGSRTANRELSTDEIMRLMRGHD